jgi:Tfp pilus assembly protein PilF
MLRVSRLALVLALMSLPGFSQSGSDPAPPSLVSSTSDNPLGDARILYGRGDFFGAIASYNKFLEQHPQSPDAYAGLTRIYLKQKNVELAA